MVICVEHFWLESMTIRVHLAGCVNDAIAMHERLRCNEDGSPNFEVRLLIFRVIR